MSEGAKKAIESSLGIESELSEAIQAFDEERAVELARKADLRSPCGDRGYPALTMAVKRGMERLARELLARGADPNERDRDGASALMWWTSNESEAMAKLLLEAGAEVDAKDGQGWTALQWAALGSNEKAARLLLEAGADCEWSNEDGDRALHLAAETGDVGVALALLMAGADWKARTALNETAEEIARKSWNGEMEDLLRSWMEREELAKSGLEERLEKIPGTGKRRL